MLGPSKVRHRATQQRLRFFLLATLAWRLLTSSCLLCCYTTALGITLPPLCALGLCGAVTLLRSAHLPLAPSPLFVSTILGGGSHLPQPLLVLRRGFDPNPRPFPYPGEGMQPLPSAIISRHGIVETSFTLLIWLDEIIIYSSLLHYGMLGPSKVRHRATQQRLRYFLLAALAWRLLTSSCLLCCYTTALGITLPLLCAL